MNLLEATGIRKRFGGVVALSDGNIVCRSGRITGLLGANGSGKSTISKIITGLFMADAGEVRFCGNQVTYKNPHTAKMDGIAMVFQNLSVIPDLTVWQNIVLGGEETKGLFLDNDTAIEKSHELIEKLYPGLDVKRKVSTLNSGEVQVTELAKALYAKPKVLILDEPTASLETAQVRNLFDYMKTLALGGIGMIFTSHRMWEVMEICDDVTVFRNGQNAGEMDFTKEKKDVDKLIGYIVGETAGKKVEKRKFQSDGETVLSVKNMNYRKRLKNISFELKKGEVLGIGGLAGQGQTELILALAGDYADISYKAQVMGKEISLNKPVNAVRNNILLVPGERQQEGLFLQHSVYKNLIFPKLALKKEPFFTKNKEYRSESEKIVETLLIMTHNIDAQVNTLSGGNQQKVVVGKWLPFNTTVMLLVDPAKGVDIGARTELYEYILRQADKGMSVILYASDTEELVAYCDRILVMHEGKIVEEIIGDKISEDAIVTASMKIKGMERDAKK
ncbi:MAG: sugar ABC transporter ATP-binding protein [Treponema sp.]|jgi:ribose transport system ATP-binding protein|nr:sugar ABC transporter ATP-binding protein [Treponema sp.]